MYKVIIIDDEEIILTGLKNIINWNKFNCFICATASNAEDGINNIKKHRPDIILTDIKMKAMTGLKMLEQVSNCISGSKVIIMTGFRDFEYARKAISLGVFAFLLKPTKLNDIQDVIGRAVNELNVQNTSIESFRKLKENEKTFKPILTEKLFSDIIAFKLTDWTKVENSLNSYGVTLNNFTVISLLINNFCEIVSQTILYSIRNMFSSKFNGRCITYLIYPTPYEDLVIVLSANNSNELGYDNLNNAVTEIKSDLFTLFNKEISVGISDIGTSVRELKLKYQESKQALEHRRYMGNGLVIFFRDLNTISQPEYEYCNLIQQNLFNCITSGNRDEIDSVLCTLINFLKKENSLIEAKSFCYDTIKKLYSSYNALNYSNHSDNMPADNMPPSLQLMISDCNDIDALADLLYRFSCDLTQKIYSYNNNVIAYTLKRAIDFIEKNYTKQITRDDIASNIHVTSNYISSIFKKGMNMTLVEYITYLRIKKAKELLKSGQYKHYEIANIIGFADSYYFSKTFKKYTGLSPSEWQTNYNLNP